MNKQKTIKTILIIGIAGLIAAGGFTLYIFNMPHRDIQSVESDYSLSASDVVAEYLADPAAANEKYLDEEGDSKVLEIKGELADISSDFNERTVLLLKPAGDKAGVSCTMLEGFAAKLNKGSMLTVKGVIRSGASFDADLNMYEHVIMEQCSLIAR